ncbi:aminotransferase class IV [Bdellovibrio sp. KM01]|uniref:aminotransferase class IV n=1 Tax=Bdellovibrio sp. KM01 TaxID=2748865 RepID=UPI0015E9E53D|nr:aminotransferase class IV [Bdellovibrio sp. KM01]QLY27079.1 aminotransferase class IV [Bdellovibrio sp. KM01]
MSVALLTAEQARAKLADKNYPAQQTYLAMYSTWWDGIVTEPGMMVVPIDDHLVHRGDGVFEAIKVVNGRVFLYEEHLRRLENSAKLIGISLPMSLDKMKSIIAETVTAAGAKDALLRLYVSRGPGGFTTNPYDSISSQMYLVVTTLKLLPPEKYLQGVSIGKSAVPPKDPTLARIKSCNYLPNVLMKKESVDRGIDFTINVDEQGNFLEGSTENVVILDRDGFLVRPPLHQILKGTTMIRTFELAEKLVQSGKIKGIKERSFTEDDVQSAKEVMMIGTTLDVLPVTAYEGVKIGSGTQGPVAKELNELLREDMKSAVLI